MKKTNKFAGFLILTLFLSLVFCRENTSEENRIETEPVVDVKVGKVERGNVSEKVVFYGETGIKYESIISSQFAGRLTKLALFEGDNVKKDQQIAIVLNELAEALLHGSAKTSSTAQKEFLKNEIKEMVILSPLSGIIVKKFKNNGDVIEKGEPILKVYDLSQLYLWGNLPSVYMTKVKPGQKTLIQFEDISDKTFSAQIDLFEGDIDPANKTIRVRIDLTNQNNFLKTGMFAKIEAITKRSNNTLLVQKSAVLTEDSKQYLFTVDGDRAKRITVKTGLKENGYIEITGGVEEGSDIVILGNSELEEGMKIRIINK